MAPRYQHIIWDWSGTLLNDVPLCMTFVNGLLAQHRLPAITPDRYRAVFAFPIREYYQQLGLEVTQDAFEAMSRAFIVHYESRCHACPLYTDAQRLLTHVRASGRSQAIVSAAPQPTLVSQVAARGLTPFFHGVIGLDNIYASSKVEAGRQWMATLPHYPSEVLLVGDTVHDFEVAEALGADCLLVAHGHQSKDRLQRSGAPIVDSLQEVLRVL
jgi:phosphoglycolate phosphatase